MVEHTNCLVHEFQTFLHHPLLQSDHYKCVAAGADNDEHQKKKSQVFKRREYRTSSVIGGSVQE